MLPAWLSASYSWARRAGMAAKARKIKSQNFKKRRFIKKPSRFLRLCFADYIHPRTQIFQTILLDYRAVLFTTVSCARSASDIRQWHELYGEFFPILQVEC